MAKARSKFRIKNDSVKLSRNGFIVLVLFVVVVSVLATYAYLSSAVIR